MAHDASMKLTDLNGRFIGAGGEGIFTRGPGGELIPAPKREGVGVMFNCPCGCDSPCFIPFDKPLDGGPPVHNPNKLWTRTGDTIETLTLRPSIQRVGGCAWHGYITNGEVTKV